METDVLSKLSKEQLEELVRTYARNMLALDGVWFQSVERELGMDRAHEARRAGVASLHPNGGTAHQRIPAVARQAGLDGLERALSLRFAAFANRQVELIRESDSLTFRVVDCRVQSARKRKGMPLHPCLSVGIREYAFFAKTIDDRIVCEPVSCFPRVSDPGCACSWRFTMGNPEKRTGGSPGQQRSRKSLTGPTLSENEDNRERFGGPNGRNIRRYDEIRV